MKNSGALHSSRYIWLSAPQNIVPNGGVIAESDREFAAVPVETKKE